MQVSRIRLCEGGPTVARIVPGLMRLPEWGLSPSELRDWIYRCLDLGLTTFDLADIYGGYSCEERFGEALALDKGLRDKIEIITKCGIQLVAANRPNNRVHHYNTSREHIVASVENSLRVLHCEQLDLLLIHRPDPLMDADETAVALTELKESGKVLHIGVSNFTPIQFELLASRLDFPLVTNQVEVSISQMAALHDGTLDMCQRLRMAPMAWSPLGGGAIFWSDSAQAQRLREVMGRIGEEVGAALDQVALAWLLRHPAKIVPVLGSGKLARLQSAVAAEGITLDRQQWFAIWEASAGHEVP